MSKFRIAICDDEELTCQEIEKIFIENSDEIGASFETDVFYTGEALIEHIRCGAAYDFLILDIELARLSGIDVGKFLREENRNFHTQIIYVSSKETYAMKLFSVQPLDFLVKSRNIEVDCDIKIPEDIDVSRAKLNVSVGNLLENAIEAATLADEKRIVFTMQFSAGILFLQIKNTYKGTIKIENGHVHGKKSYSNHGIGLRSVQDLVREQNGNLNISVTDQFFVAEGMIPMG